MKKQQSLIEGKDFYYNEDGLVVLTREYHLKRGFCCESGCKHCPYNKKSKLKSTSKKLKVFFF